MAKDPFLLVSLEESESKNLAQVISNDTARKILDFLSKSESATESDISKELAVPLSTVHYNLQALVKANLVKTEEFHYSEKGKEVLHYSLANKIIIIAPKSANKDNFLQKLKGLLPVAIVSAGAAATLQVASKYFNQAPIEIMPPEANLMMAKSADSAIAAMGTEAADALANETTIALAQEVQDEAMLFAAQAAPEITNAQVNIFSGDYISLWFLAGSLVAILTMLAWNAYKARKK